MRGLRALLPLLLVALLAGCGLAPELHVFPAGSVSEEALGHPLEITPEDLATVARAANEQRTPVPVLFEHGDGPRGGAAAGFLDRCRPDLRGLFCTFRWTDEGVAAACRGGWRYVSPRFDGPIDAAGRLHPERLIEVSVTNIPALEGLSPVPVPPCPLSMFPREGRL